MARRKTLTDLIDKFTPEIQRAFKAAIANIRNDAQLGQIETAIRAGDINQALRFTGLSEAALRPITAAIDAAYEAGGVFTASQVPRQVGQAAFRFDVRNSRAEAWLRDHSSTLITNITNQQTDMIRNAIMDGVAAGRNPKNIALDLIGRIDPVSQKRVGGLIGLDNQRSQYLQNARRELEELDPAYFNRGLRDARFDSTVRKAINSGTPLSTDQINGITARYSNNLLQSRGETIARTEALASLNQSQQEAIQQIVDTGQVTTQDVTRIWDATDHGPPNGRTRPSHVEMDGQEVGMNEPFKTPSGDLLMFPGDSSLGAPAEETINCRCRVRLKVGFTNKWRGQI